MESFAARYNSTYAKSQPRWLQMNGREYSPSSWARRYRAQRAAGQSYSYSYPDITIETATEFVRSMPDRYSDEIAATSDTILRVRPDERTWSVLEYLCHVRDVYTVGTIRLYRIRAEDRPTLEPMLND